MFAHVTNRVPLTRPPSHPCFLPGSRRKHVKASRRNERREREEGTPTAFVIVASKCDVPKRTDDADADDGEEDEERT